VSVLSYIPKANICLGVCNAGPGFIASVWNPSMQSGN